MGSTSLSAITSNSRALHPMVLNPATGLPSRVQIERDFPKGASVTELRFTVLLLNIADHLDLIQRSHEHYVSEWVVYQTGRRIERLLLEDDRLYHTQDAEFVLTLAPRRQGSLSDFIAELLEVVQEPFSFSDFNLRVRGTLGGARYPDDGTDIPTLIHRANIALGAARRQRLSSLLYTESLFTGLARQADLHKNISRALESGAEGQGQFSMYFQPKLTLERQGDGRFRVRKIEAEALIRWMHPDRGWISPAEFIPLAEETGLILPLGKWTLYQVADRLAEWARSDLSHVGVSVNLSARQFLSDDLIEVLSHLVSTRGVVPARMTVEVTETSLFEDTVQTKLLINNIKSLGMRISVDDFGTGYSSLSLLHQYPFDELKVDRLFIEMIRENANDQSIVASLIELSRNLGLHLVAEGIDSMEVLELLLDMGCTGFQGWVFSKALPAEEFETFCRTLSDRDFFLSGSSLLSVG